MPDVGMFAVGDQLAVAGRDLAVALETAPSVELDEAVRLVEEATAPGVRVAAFGQRPAESLRGTRASRRSAPAVPGVLPVGQSEAMTRSARM